MADTSAFPWTKAQLDAVLRKAIASYWTGRGGQSQRQGKLGAKDVGTRAEVTGGQHLNAVLALLVTVAKSAGFSESEIHLSRDLELPGYFRPQKRWDLVIVREQRLCAAIELKSQVGSFGNNFNNRSEEAIGSSTDFWTAYREGALGLQAPWLGFFFLLEQAEQSTRPVALKRGTFPALPVFANTSYAQRYALLCERLLLERKYSAATLVMAPRSQTGEYTEPNPQLSFAALAKSLHAHLVGCR